MQSFPFGMNVVVFEKCITKLPSSQFRCLQICFRELMHTARNKKLDKALRILDLINPKETVPSGRETHLRLIQDFLQPDSNQVNVKEYDRLLSCSSLMVSEFVDRKGDLSNENAIWVHLDGEELRIDAGVLSYAVSLCGSRRKLRSGIQLHCLAIRIGYNTNVFIGSSLISLYGKCGLLNDAYNVFEDMPVRNVVSWTAIISEFSQDLQVDVCVELYGQMRISMSKPNDFTFTSLLSAFTDTGALGQGRSMHCQIIQMGFDSYIQIDNALISMYCKCGDINDALHIFHNMPIKDIISWNSMIAGCAQHGHALQALNLFEEMKQTMTPDAITFLVILSSCRHAGLVKQGRIYFHSMVEHGVTPEIDHYSCVVDLLGRAGLLEEALEFIENMPIYPTAIIWGSLLSSCRNHGSVWMGIHAAESRLVLEPGCAATHVQLANLYASAGCWEEAARVRKTMKDKGLKTNLGYSWIEIKNEIYRFRAEDRSNARFIEIVTLLDSLLEHMKTLCYVSKVHKEDADEILCALV